MTPAADAPHTPTTDLAIVRRYPAINRGLRRHPLCVLPTPVAPLVHAARARGVGPLWVKCDDVSSALYGGNKPRKLEWLLGAALARGRRGVITFGGIGTHHGLATAICARDAGLPTVLVLLPQPVTDHVRHMLLLHHAFGSEMHLAESVAGVATTALRRVAQGVRTGKPLAIIPTGGTSALGSIGYVNAACELADQVRAGLLPEPAAIFVPVGSGGTLSGLVAGAKLAGVRSKIIGVGVSDILPPGSLRLAGQARRALALLKRHFDVPPVYVRPSDFTLINGYVGAAYGAPTLAATAASRRALASEGLTLDTTYTAKCMAAMLAVLTIADYRDRPVLFWNTYSSVDPELHLGELPDYRSLPPAFHRFFEGDALE